MQAIGLPSVIVPIPYPCPNEIYEARMAAALDDAKRAGVTHVIFGDLFLEDVRAYREEKLAGTGIAPLFPLWQRPTGALAREMIDAGVETYLVCVDLKQLPKSFAGRRFDHALLADLPATRRPVRREGRVSLLRGGGTDVLEADRCDGRRDDRAGWVCVHGPIPPRVSGERWTPRSARTDGASDRGPPRPSSARRERAHLRVTALHPAAPRRCACSPRRRSSPRPRRSPRRSSSCRAAAW